MPYVFYNPNPKHRSTIDCVIRAISKLMDVDWDTAYIKIMIQGFIDKSMPSSDSVWGNYLKNNGYRKTMLPDTCPDCYTIRRFCEDHPYGRFLLKTTGHVVAVCNGDYYDTWDSGDEIPIYYFEWSVNKYGRY